MTPDLSIVIVTFNACEHVMRCLASIEAAPPSVSHQIVVVDNGSTDGTIAAVGTMHPDARILEVGANVGFAAAANRGAAATASPHVLFLNSDTEVQSGSLDRLLAGLTCRPHAAVVGPRIVDADGRPELSVGRMVGPFTELIQKRVVLGHAKRRTWAARYVDRQTRLARQVDWVSGACMVVRRRDGEAAGWFDEQFFLYFEDVDFCARLRSRGRQIWFSPAAEITHARGRSRATVAEAAERAYRQSQLAFYAKHHPRWLPLLRVYLGSQRKLRGGSPVAQA